MGIKLDNSIALDSCIGQKFVGPRGSRRVVRDRVTITFSLFGVVLINLGLASKF